MCGLNLKPEEVETLRASERCQGCGHLQDFHRHAMDTDEYCTAARCRCDRLRTGETEAWEEIAALGERHAGINLIRVDGAVVPIF